jgi:adenylosuccinate synthase
MPVTMVIDSGLGDSGKAKLVEYLTLAGDVRHVVGGGVGPGAAWHQYADPGGQRIDLQQVPPGVTQPRATLYLGPGTLVDLRMLAAELARLARYQVRGRMVVDRRCGIVEPAHREAEETAGLASRGVHWDHGCAGARAAYILRQIRQAGQAADPPCAIADVVLRLSEVSAAQDVLVAAEDGPEYDLYTSDHYPLTVSDGCSAAAVLARTGLAWCDLRQVIGVVNMLPTTVLPLPLASELSAAELTRRKLHSRGLVTGLRRRVAACPDLAQLARFVSYQRPTALALGRADMFDPAARSATRLADLPSSVRDWMTRIEDRTAVPVRYVSTGPGVTEVVDLS